MRNLLCDLLRSAGKSCMGLGGFMVDEEGRLIEKYDEDGTDETESEIRSEGRT